MPNAIPTANSNNGITKFTRYRLAYKGDPVVADLWVSSITGTILSSQETFFDNAEWRIRIQFLDDARERCPVCKSLSSCESATGGNWGNIRQRSSQNGRLLFRCIAQCQESTYEIQQLVEKIETQLSRHARIGKLYTVFKEPDVKDLLEKLDRARSSLELAYIIYLGDEQRRFHGLHMQTLAYHTHLLQAFQQEFGAKNCCSHGTAPVQHSEPEKPFNGHPGGSAALWVSNSRHPFLKPKQLKKKHSKTVFRVRCYLPEFASKGIWDMALTRSQCGWSMHLRTYNIIPSNATIIRYCEAGELSKVREAFAKGEATPLDVCCDEFNSHWTLLEMAAVRGQLETCRYLLSQTSWPDSIGVLSRALSNFTFRYHRSELQEEIYRLFFGLVGFDTDADDDSRTEWLYWCRGGQSLDVVLHNVFPGFQAQSAELRCVGLQPSDQRLATLRNSNGGTVLHFVARRLFLRRHSLIASEEVQALLTLATFLLRHGADFCAVADANDREWLKHAYASIPANSTSSETDIKITPLLALLGKSFLRPLPPQRSDLKYYLSAMRTWIGLAHTAGIDLCAYGIREQRAWSDLGVQGQHRIHAVSIPTMDLLFGSTPDLWTLQMSYSQPCRLYTLDKLPGSYPEENHLPSVIMWFPTKEEEAEGRWSMIVQRRLPHRVTDVEQTLAQKHLDQGVQKGLTANRPTYDGES
ncbi:hypothetical protein HJFPF1_00088 [Paramyrothecium foliicola]|nr:hypothetical protein HJFPF1_00088 [Paramyrothecium foliicola]